MNPFSQLLLDSNCQQNSSQTLDTLVKKKVHVWIRGCSSKPTGHSFFFHLAGPQSDSWSSFGAGTRPPFGSVLVQLLPGISSSSCSMLHAVSERDYVNKQSKLVVQRWLPKELREDALKAAREPVLGGGDVEITSPAVARRRRRKKEAKKTHRYTNGSFSGRATERVASRTASTMP